MKKVKVTKGSKVISMIYSAGGLALAVVPKLTVCPVGNDSVYMPCWQSAQLLTWTGLIILLMGILTRYSRKLRVKTIADGLAAVSAYISMLIPARIIGGCIDSSMLCHRLGFPLIYAVSIFIVLTAMVSVCISAVQAVEKAAGGIRTVKY